MRTIVAAVPGAFLLISTLTMAADTSSGVKQGSDSAGASAADGCGTPIWLSRAAAPKTDGKPSDSPDTYVAFRGLFDLSQPSKVEFRTLGAGWFVAWLDGALSSEGPARFPKAFPQYDTVTTDLPAGKHVLAVQVHHIGVTTRLLYDMPPFFACQATANGKPLAIRWKCEKLAGYAPQVRRVNPQLGWIEWCDTRQIPARWRTLDFDDRAWGAPEPRDPGIGPVKPLPTATTRQFVLPAKMIAKGLLAEVFGYEQDDIPARFSLRDLQSEGGSSQIDKGSGPTSSEALPPQGVWRRYDLGRVRLARPRFELDLPAGAVVEFAYSESLKNGRVLPYITLSAGASCNLDHYVARGGPQEFFPLTPRGGRFVEIHVLADPAKVRFVREEFVERGYHGEPQGDFRCDDPLLNRIWRTGIETYRACAEDSLIDNPTRERGEWTGDVTTVGLDISAAGYCDIRLIRRGLTHSAQCARPDGLVAGLCPGGEAYLSTYAAQWVPACMHYWELTGDRTILEELFPYAERNLAAFERHVTKDGLTDAVGWGFVDWGYVRSPGPIDIALNLHYLASLRSMVRWCETIGQGDRAGHYRALERKINEIVKQWFAARLAKGDEGWKEIGYHAAVLGLRLGYFQGAAERDCIAFAKRHILSCFPNDPSAPRNADPTASERRLITPYFAHFAFPSLLERGEIDFILDQYRTCWGWALGGGRTTWVEVFDTRWTHCHQWSGCPTWQLTRYALGLHPRFDLGKNHLLLRLTPGKLKEASGRVPLASGDVVEVRWNRGDDGRIAYQIQSPTRVWLHFDPDGHGQPLEISGERKLTLSEKDGRWMPAE